MNVNELLDIFDDNDEEIIHHIQNLRTYTVRERPDHFTWNEEEFFRRFRLRKDTVRNLVLEIGDYLRYNTEQYHEIDPTTQILLTIRFYATGQFYIATGDFRGIHKTTAGRLIKRVRDAILTLRLRIITSPNNEEDKRKIKSGFYRLARFPNVIGAVDRIQIPIQSRGGPNAEIFRNRKGWFSLNTQVICDSRNYILDIVGRWPGSSHDSHVFRNSLIKERFENGEFNESILLGDSAYPLTNYLMTPLPNPRTAAEELYNRSHISTTTVIERTFGIWKKKICSLDLGLRCKTALAQKIIVATAILHNIAVLNRDEFEDDGAIPDNEYIVFPENQNNFNNHIQ